MPLIDLQNNKLTLTKTGIVQIDRLYQKTGLIRVILDFQKGLKYTPHF